MHVRHQAQAVCVLALLCGAEVSAQTAVTNGRALAPLWDACRSRRVDLLCVGDSNQLHRGAGWDEAVAVVWGGEFGLYATGLHTLGENGGVGAGVGAGSATINTGGTGGARTAGAPSSARLRLDSEASGLSPLNYLYIASGETLSFNTPAGLSLSDDVLFDFSGRLRFHITFATFADTGGSFTPCIREEGGVELLRGAQVSTSSADGVARTSLDLPAQTRSNPIALRLAADNASPVHGPFVGYYARSESVDAQRGIAVHCLYAKGGQSAYDMAVALQSTSDETLTLFLQEAVRLQSGSPIVAVRICTGLNDRVESMASVGPDPQSPGNSPTAFADNLVAIVDRVSQGWTLAGFDTANLYFIITPSHPVPGEEETPLRRYRFAAADVAKNRPRVASVDFGALTDAHELEKNSWFVTQGDYNHLRQDGMRALSRRELDALIESAKP